MLKKLLSKKYIFLMLGFIFLALGTIIYIFFGETVPFAKIVAVCLSTGFMVMCFAHVTSNEKPENV